MPLTVVTLSKVPRSLRGDLSKWMQEIAPGVYVGNFNTRIREELWVRITESVKNGEATMCYAFRNEIGYNFKTVNTESQVIEYDGIPLVMFPHYGADLDSIKNIGFSDASKRRAAKRFTSVSGSNNLKDGDIIDLRPLDGNEYVVIDLETDGLDKDRHRIIEIGAIRVTDKGIDQFSCLIKHSKDLPKEISSLTNISDEMIRQKGVEEKEAIAEFKEFIGDFDLVGYNLSFDMGFISKALERLQMENIHNDGIDLIRYVKKEKIFLDNYKLDTVLKEYEISERVPHRALLDAELIYRLSCKLTKFQSFLKGKPAK